MKILSVIFAVYIVVLAAMPCADIHAADNDKISVELQEQNHSHSGDVDLCTPFCYCTCCQTLSQPTIYSTFQINLVGFNLATPLIVKNEMKCTIFFWRPPKF